METITQFVLPIAVVFLTWVVGLELTPADFRRVGRNSRFTVVAVLGQYAVWPAAAGITIWLHRPSAPLAAAVILIAAAPAGGFSNFLTYLSRGNIALSVTLTAVTQVIGVLTYPLLAAAGFALFLGEAAGVGLPVGLLIRQLVLIMLLPISAGMLVRHYRPALVERYRGVFRRIALPIVLIIVGLIVMDQGTTFLDQLAGAAPLSVSLTSVAMIAGYLLARGLGAPPADRITLLYEYAVRHTALAIFVAATTLGRLDYAGFMVAFFVVEMVLLLAFATAMQLKGRMASHAADPA